MFCSCAAYSDSKDLAKRAILDKILRYRADEIARNHGYDGYQRALASISISIREQDQGGVSMNN